MTIMTQFFAAGKIIFREGDAPGKAYLVKSGKVKLYKGSDQNKTELGIIEVNGVFGEMSLIDNRPRSATAVAAENTYLIVIDQQGLEERLSALDPFMRGLFRILATRLRDTNEQLAKHKRASDVS